MKYKLRDTNKNRNAILAGYQFKDGICEVDGRRPILEKYYSCTIVEEVVKPKRRGRSKLNTGVTNGSDS